MAVESQFNGIFHHATAVAGRERRGGVWQLHAGKSLREETLVRNHNTLKINPFRYKIKPVVRKEDVTCVLEVSMVGMGLAFDPERGV